MNEQIPSAIEQRSEEAREYGAGSRRRKGRHAARPCKASFLPRVPGMPGMDLVEIAFRPVGRPLRQRILGRRCASYRYQRRGRVLVE